MNEWQKGPLQKWKLSSALAELAGNNNRRKSRECRAFAWADETTPHTGC